MPSRSPLLSRLLLLLSLATAGAAQAADDWQLIDEQDGIRVYRLLDEALDRRSFRGVTVMPVTDFPSIVAVINDYPNLPRWLYFVSAAQEFGRRGPLDRDVLVQTDLPWPLTDREAVLRALGTQPPDGYDIDIRLINQPALLPPNEDYIRFPELDARLLFRWLGEGRLEVTYQIVADPGGWVPDWLAARVLRDAPYYTLRDLRRTLNRPEYQGHSYDYLRVPPVAARPSPGEATP